MRVHFICTLYAQGVKTYALFIIREKHYIINEIFIPLKENYSSSSNHILRACINKNVKVFLDKKA